MSVNWNEAYKFLKAQFELINLSRTEPPTGISVDASLSNFPPKIEVVYKMNDEPWLTQEDLSKCVEHLMSAVWGCKQNMLVMKLDATQERQVRYSIKPNLTFFSK